MIEYVLFDTETTGNGEEDRIIQVGALIIDSRGQVKYFDELCSSEVEIKFEAMEVHNITPELIEGRRSFRESSFFEELLRLNVEKNYLIAHNINFDLAMLEKEGFKNRMQLIDTLRCSKHLFPDSPYHRLQYFRYSLGLYRREDEEAGKYNISIKAHNAISDVLVMKLLLSELVKEVKVGYPDVNPMKRLAELTKTPVMLKEFKFGKYNGEKIGDIAKRDIRYLKWVYNNMDLDEDMRYTLELYL